MGSKVNCLAGFCHCHVTTTSAHMIYVRMRILVSLVFLIRVIDVMLAMSADNWCIIVYAETI